MNDIEVNDIEVIEILCGVQDRNKEIKLTARNEDQIRKCNKLDDLIQEQFSKLYIN